MPTVVPGAIGTIRREVIVTRRAVASGTAAGTAVWSQSYPGPADITLAGGLSPYGVMGQGGNVWEWEETEFDLVNDQWFVCPRGARRRLGSYSSYVLSVVGPRLGGPSDEDINVGFRVASIPEPSSLLLERWLAGTVAAEKVVS